MSAEWLVMETFIMPKKKKKKVTMPVSPSEKHWGILFELENIALNARHVEFQVIHALLSGKGIPLTPSLFSRFCVDTPPRQYLDKLAASSKKTGGAREKLLSEIEEGLLLSLTGGIPGKSALLIPILKAAAAPFMHLGALSSLDEENTSHLITRLDLSDRIKATCSYRSGARACPTPETWALLARKLSLPPWACIAVATSGKSCQAALATGMRCVAIPDAFTSFQDFSGADHVLDTVSDQALLAALTPPEDSP